MAVMQRLMPYKNIACNFGALNLLNLEHALILSDYNSWKDYRNAIEISHRYQTLLNCFVYLSALRTDTVFWSPHVHHRLDQGVLNFMVPPSCLSPVQTFIQNRWYWRPVQEFVRDLINFFHNNTRQMTEVNSSQPQHINWMDMKAISDSSDKSVALSRIESLCWHTDLIIPT